jgi:hypothetical protein
VVLLEGVAANKVARDDPARTFWRVFESYDNHAVASSTTTPTIEAVLFADLVGSDEFQIAVGANVVVTTIAS